MPKEKKQIANGLILAKPDKRDFSHTKVFGMINLKEIPDNFEVAKPLKIKQQYDSDMCVAGATCAVVEDHEDVPLSMEWFFSQMKRKQGNWRTWGSDLQTGAKVAVEKGFIEEKDAPYSLKDKNREFCANWTNWPNSLSLKAVKHRQGSYFRADGYNSTFDAFRATMYQNRAYKRSIMTGCTFERAWEMAEGGIIPEKPGEETFGHALKFFGQKKIGRKLYLKAQLSNGNVGDHGIFYFPKSVVDRKFVWKNFLFIDLPPAQAKKLCWSWWRRLIEFIKNLWT